LGKVNSTKNPACCAAAIAGGIRTKPAKLSLSQKGSGALNFSAVGRWQEAATPEDMEVRRK
jgi:stage V sporulation protein SpoVS